MNNQSKKINKGAVPAPSDIPRARKTQEVSLENTLEANPHQSNENAQTLDHGQRMPVRNDNFNFIKINMINFQDKDQQISNFVDMQLNDQKFTIKNKRKSNQNETKSSKIKKPLNLLRNIQQPMLSNTFQSLHGVLVNQQLIANAHDYTNQPIGNQEVRMRQKSGNTGNATQKIKPGNMVDKLEVKQQTADHGMIEPIPCQIIINSNNASAEKHKNQRLSNIVQIRRSKTPENMNQLNKNYQNGFDKVSSYQSLPNLNNGDLRQQQQR